jgi:hypothetical protein
MFAQLVRIGQIDARIVLSEEIASARISCSLKLENGRFDEEKACEHQCYPVLYMF